jgi:putative DNA primase/helicase
MTEARSSGSSRAMRAWFVPGGECFFSSARRSWRLVRACPVLIRAWFASGQPSFTGRPLDSYESWSRAIGGILDVAGIPGFLGNVAEVYAEASVEGQAFRALVAEWDRTFGSQERSAADLVSVAEDHLNLGDGTERSKATCLGKKLGEYRDRVFVLADGQERRVAKDGSDRKPWRLLSAVEDGPPKLQGEKWVPGVASPATPSTGFPSGELRTAARECGQNGPRG